MMDIRRCLSFHRSCPNVDDVHRNKSAKQWSILNKASALDAMFCLGPSSLTMSYHWDWAVRTRLRIGQRFVRNAMRPKHEMICAELRKQSGSGAIMKLESRAFRLPGGPLALGRTPQSVCGAMWTGQYQLAAIALIAPDPAGLTAEYRAHAKRRAFLDVIRTQARRIRPGARNCRQTTDNACRRRWISANSPPCARARSPSRRDDRPCRV